MAGQNKLLADGKVHFNIKFTNELYKWWCHIYLFQLDNWSYLDVLTFLLFGDEGSGGAQDCFLLCTLVTPATGPAIPTSVGRM